MPMPPRPISRKMRKSPNVLSAPISPIGRAGSSAGPKAAARTASSGSPFGAPADRCCRNCSDMAGYLPNSGPPPGDFSRDAYDFLTPRRDQIGAFLFDVRRVAMESDDLHQCRLEFLPRLCVFMVYPG